MTHLHSGKVRDIYTVDQPADPDAPAQLLMVASDRISAYDVVLEPTIPDKGEILTRMSLWWFDRIADIVPNHVISTDVPPQVAGRAVLCERLDMYPVECVVRGYLSGSGFADYQRTGLISGVRLPDGLVNGSELDEPIFTPATKAQYGYHDENITYEALEITVGKEDAAALRELSLAAYRRAEQIARERGVILADTKFEFGRRPDDEIVLADEVLTPDSSRFWPDEDWEPGGTRVSYDKQFVRDWLTSSDAGWDRVNALPPPGLPDEIVDKTRQRYIRVFEQLTGETF